MDKIGDLVLSLPIDQTPKALGADVHWLISEGTGFVVAASVPLRSFFEFPKQFSWKNLWQLVAWVRHLKPDVSVVLHGPWWVNLALWIARIPYRSGRKSQWHSYLFLNAGVRQSRKQGLKHETDLNLELLQLGLSTHPHFSEVRDVSEIAPLQLRRPSGVNISNLPKDFIVVHPGMAGSALNWPMENYDELIKKIVGHHPVIVTGTKNDRFILEPLKSRLSSVPNIIWLNEKLSASELLYVLAMAHSVIAPSTGVLHLSASLGTKSVGLYSSIPVQSPQRWGPRGPNTIVIETPATAIEAQTAPLNAMKKITVEQVFEALL